MYALCFAFLSDSQTESNNMEQDLQTALAIKRELESLEGEKSAKVKALEKNLKLNKAEKDDLIKVRKFVIYLWEVFD